VTGRNPEDLLVTPWILTGEDGVADRCRDLGSIILEEESS
jgi:hypothetical protein